MKKKLLLLLMVLFLGLAGPMKAQNQVTIGSGTTTNNYLPTYELYNYSLSQQIYTASEIGQAGMITEIAFNYAATSSVIRNLTIYINHRYTFVIRNPSDFFVCSIVRRNDDLQAFTLPFY